MHSLYLLYHELRPTPSSYTYVLPCEDFEKQVELFAQMQQAKSPSVRPEVTFDDGHISNYEYALPILQRHNVQAHFFITVGWTAQRPGYMDWNHLRALHQAGQIIGAHGWSHTLLTHCSKEQLQKELVDARKALQDHLSADVTTMSLPGGRFNRQVLEACHEAGYTQVFTSIPRKEPVPPGSEIGRINILATMTLPWLTSLLQPQSPTLAKLEQRDRIKSAAKSLLGDRLYTSLWGLVNRQEPEIDPQAERPTTSSAGKTLPS